MIRFGALLVAGLALGCSGETTGIDAGGNDASFDGIPVVCGVVVVQSDLCIHCATAPGTSQTCHGTCLSNTNPGGQCGAFDDAAAPCGDIACGAGCTCFNPKDGVCQCEK